MKIRRGDNVMILAGKDKGKSGLVERVFVDKGRLVIKGVATAKKHIKPSRKNPQGGIIDINLPINHSNVMIICPSCGKPTRIGAKITDGKKIRVCRRCGQSAEGNSQ